jgi:O-antigen ligase
MRLELLALFAFAFVLPLFEAPKNLLWIVYAVLWIANRYRARSFGGPWGTWDTLILAWIASGYLSAAFAGLHHHEWISGLDILRYASILWLLKRSGYDETSLLRLFASTIVGTLVGLAWGYYGLRIAGERSTLGLNSVGHVNHSAIYMSIVLGMALAWARAEWGGGGVAKRTTGAACVLALSLGLILTESRAAVGAAFVVALFIFGAHSLRSKRSLWGILVAVAIVAAGLLAANPGIVRKNTHLVKENIFLAYRDSVWRTGLKAWREFPVFGVGIGNYSQVSIERVEAWGRSRGDTVDPSLLQAQAHGHSLFVNTLVERGLTGMAALLAILLAWGWSLMRNIPNSTDAPVRWTYWGGASAAWLVTVIVGTVNTTLHHEHALVSMLLLGGWLVLRNKQRSPDALRT